MILRDTPEVVKKGTPAAARVDAPLPEWISDRQACQITGFGRTATRELLAELEADGQVPVLRNHGVRYHRDGLRAALLRLAEKE
jgi:DNA-binding FadR family transcriptional regulator